ncbi:MAG: DNA/RNA nuclease SfsA [Alphaproteobacteria bacterium]|jgi:sugar fermentation stimulation protein A|nr:DNA/RNA nuclease SfsA [Alphaproteobacteria bacterium]|tara:strand:+ start:711 stop:1439 length:729 start_codon:yes stop_codon:yes gene_type:complete
MKFPDTLVTGILVRRYKRFLADIELDSGEIVVAHCANPGAMTGLNTPGFKVWLAPNRNPKAKLDWRWELVQVNGYLIGINTAHPNAIVAEAINAGKIDDLKGYESLRREVKYGQNSRIDILLESPGRPPCYVEIKNVHLRRPEGKHPTAAEFPDSVTKRGTKHLNEMANMVGNGARAVMFYLVQRSDCDHFRLAADIDRVYAETFSVAKARGVEAICYVCDLTETGINVNHTIPIIVGDAAS